MKALERIFLYSVLAILVFYVFLVDNKVESQVAIQEEIRARRIVIVNDEGREVVLLSASKDGNGAIVICNKDGTPAAFMGANEYGGAMSIKNKDGTPAANMIAIESGGTMDVSNKDGILVVVIGASEYGGIMGVYNKDGNVVAGMRTNENDNGMIEVFNKHSKVIGSLP